MVVVGQLQWDSAVATGVSHSGRVSGRASGPQWVARCEVRYEILLGGSVTVGHSGWRATGPPPIPTSNVDAERSCPHPTHPTHQPSSRCKMVRVASGGRRGSQRLTRSGASGSHLPPMRLSSSIEVGMDPSTASHGFQYPTTGRDARASRSSSAHPPEPTHCSRGARAGLSVHPAMTPL